MPDRIATHHTRPCVAPARSPTLLLSRITLCVMGLLTVMACEPTHVIPARQQPHIAATKPSPKPIDAKALRQGGTLIFEDDFSGPLSQHWRTEHEGWTIVDGWVHSRRALNKGLWLHEPKLPANVRIEFDARSEPKAKGFDGDLKCEAFATEPRHEAGYIFINGGWGNSIDALARLDEHQPDRLQAKAQKVKASQVYHWTLIRVGNSHFWFRDDHLMFELNDPQAVGGSYFGFNNWEAMVYFDNVKIYRLEDG